MAVVMPRLFAKPAAMDGSTTPRCGSLWPLACCGRAGGGCAAVIGCGVTWKWNGANGAGGLSKLGAGWRRCGRGIVEATT